VLTLVAVSVTAATAAACGGGSDDASGVGADGKIELTVATFGEFGFEDLLPEYENTHPNIRITPRKTGEAGPHHEDVLTKLGAGSGLADIVAIEEGHMSDFVDKGDKFNDLVEIGPKDVTADRWLPWKYDGGKDADGRLIGYGTDIGPLAMCYREDMFKDAGLPTDPASVQAIFSSWDSFFAAGDQFVRGSGGKAWFDSAAQIFNAMTNQLEVGYLDRDDKLTLETNPKFKQNWDAVTGAVGRGQSAKLIAFSNEWTSGFAAGKFATKTCPSWMLGVVEEHSGPANAGKWAVSGTFPGGGGNWGGSYLTVPKQSKHAKEAAELAAWLTAPEQQLKAFAAKGTFPSQVKALESAELLAVSDDYFVGAVKTGQLFAEQARKVVRAQYKGPGDGQIQENALAPALQAVEQGKASQDGWQQLVDQAKKIVR